MDLVQWGIAAIISILTFLGGRSFERRRIAQQNRLKLLEPVEDWVEHASRLIGIVGDELSAITQGLPFPVAYGPEDRAKTAKRLGENKEKVLGILKSEALHTRGTRPISSRLADLVVRLDLLIEREYLQAYYRLFESLEKRVDPGQHMAAVLIVTSAANALIQEIHSCLAELKTRYN